MLISQRKLLLTTYIPKRLQRDLHNNTFKVTQHLAQPKTWESHSRKCQPFTFNRGSYKHTYEIAERSPPQHFEGFAPMNAV